MRAKRLPLGLKKTKHKKVIKRLMIAALSLFVIFSQMSLSPLGKAFAEDNNSNTQQFFDSVKLTTGENDAAKDVSADNPLKKGDAVNLDYSWTQKAGQQLSADKDITIQIPSQFKVGTKDAEGKYTTDATGAVKLADNTTVIGTYTVKASDAVADANKLTIHFDSEKSQNLTGASGKLVIPAVFDDEIKADQTTDTIDFDLGSNQKQTANFAVKAEAEQTEAASSDSKTAASDASSSDSSKSSDASSTNDQTKADASSTDEAKTSDSSSSKDGSSADGSSVQANKDGSDEGQTSSADSSSTGNVSSQQQSSNQLRNFSAFSAQSTSNEITNLQPSSIKLVDPDNGDKEYTADYPATPDSSVKIEYAWDVPENVRQTINEGDTLSFTLPDLFSIPSDQAPLSGELLDKGVDYGSFTVDASGKVTMTFSKEFQNHNNVSFGMYVTAQINKQNTGDSTTKVINFPINGKSETATIYFEDGFSSPIKKDFSNFDSKHNPKEITWQVDVNLNKDELQNAQVVEDLASEGLTFDSVSVYPLSTNAVTGTIGSADTSHPLSESTSADGDKGEYSVDKSTGTVTLGHITGAYRLIYKTKINNDQIPSNGGSKKFTNTATLKDEQTTLGSDPAQASTTYGKLLTKTYLGQDANNKQLTHWEIDYNYGEKTISHDQAIITDTFKTDMFQFLNVKVQKVTWSASGVPAYSDITSGYHVNSTSSGFQIVFDQDVTSAYKITYDLAVKPGNVYIDQGTDFSNKAEVGTVSSGEIPGHVDQQSLIKSHSNIDYQKKTVDWKIMVNEKNYPLNNWSIDDTFSYPLSNLTNLRIYTATPSPGSNGAVTWTQGSDVTSNFNIGSTNSKGQPGFTIAPKSGSAYYNTTGTFMITYTTNFNGYTSDTDTGNITTISNDSILDWYDVTTKINHETTTNDNFPPNSYTQTNGFKTHENYDPVNQNVLWKVYVNYNEEPLENAYINDPIPDGMKFDDTVPVKVYKYDINSDGSVTNEKEITSGFTITKPTSGNNALRVDFSGLNGDKGHYMVSFATDLRGQVVQSSYTNNATFKNGDYPARTLTDSVQPKNGGQWLGKYGTQDGKYVTWNLEVNKSLSVIDPGMVITDTSSPGQIVDKNSLEIYPVKVTNGVVQTDGSGHLAADTDHPLSASDYSVNVPAPDSSGKQVFTITFNKQINATAYVVSYKSLINISKSTGTLTNSAEFNGNNSQVIQDTNNQNTNVVNLSAGGWAVGTTGTLTVHKTGHTVLGDSPLKNVTFELWSEDENGTPETLLRTGTTDDSGNLTFSGLVFGSVKYKLIETSTLDGYVVNAPQEIDTSKIASGSTISVVNNQNQLSVEKLVNDGDSAKGTQFTLYKKDLAGDYNVDTTMGNNGVFAISDESAKIVVAGLPQGDYYLSESQAPTGYLINDNKISFSVNQNNQIVNTSGSAITDPIQLQDYKGSAQIKKVDGENPSNGLDNAIFDVYKSGGTIPVQSGITSKNGGIVKVTGLAPGSYYFKETKAPSGYQINEHTINFTIPESANGQQTVTPTESTLPDYKGSAQIKKVDGENPSNGLDNAIFDVYKSGSTTPVQSGITSKNGGIVKVTGLAPGSYYFKETRAPKGYLINNDEIQFTIPSAADGEQVVIPNESQFSNYHGSVQLSKVDENGNALDGAIFKITDLSGTQKFADNLISKNGVVYKDGLAPGMYKFVETQAPTGYIQNLDEFIFEILAEAEGVPSTVVIKDPFINYKGSAVLTKYNADKTQVLKGAEFQLQKQDATDNWTNQGGAQEATDGTLTVKDLTPGKYQFVEIQAPDGYLIHEPVGFTIVDENKGNPTAEQVPISDQLNSIVLTKKDKNDTNAKLIGAVYKLVKAGTDTVITKDINNKDLPENWITDEHGQFTVNGLAPGKYNFIETKAPNGYELDATPIPFEVTNTDVKAVEITATDKINSIILTKADKNDKDAVLAGAEFKLYDSNGNLVAKDANGKALPTVWKTNDQGQFTINGLAPGNYHFIETKAPKNYDLDATPIPFQVTATDVKAIEITATDKLTPGDVRLTKVDRNDKDAVLKGAVFKLTDSNGKTLKTGLTTDNSGQFVVKGLAPGKYFFIETKAPKNYALDDTPIPFVIEKGQAKAVEITATDKPLEVTKSLDGKPGATYNVVDENGHVITRGVMADEEGNVNFKGLATGKYHLVLVRGVEAEVQTTKKSKGLPITGDVNDIMTMAAGAILLLGGGFLTIFSRRRRKN